MRRSEIDAITRGLEPAIREFVARAVAPHAVQHVAVVELLTQAEEQLDAQVARIVELEAQVATLNAFAKPLIERNAVLEQRLVALEAREVVPGPAGAAGATGAPGVGLFSLSINADGRLVAILSDGRQQDVGPVPVGPPGEPGRDGRNGQDGAAGPAGADGADGAAGTPGPPGPPGPQGDPGEQGEKGLDGVVGQRGPQGLDGVPGPPGEKGLDGAPGAAGAVGERGVPGPVGERGAQGLDGVKGLDGAPGRDGRDGAQGLPGLQGERGEKGLDGLHGKDGRDGMDGLGIDDVDTVFDEATGAWVLRMSHGDRVKDCRLPVIFDAGVYTAGKAYPLGASVSWDGGTWIAQQATSSAPGDGDSWRLSVRRGKQGREGRPGKDGAPGRDLTQMDAAGRKW